MLAGDRLIEVWAFRDDDARPRIASATRQLSDAGIVVELEWGDRKHQRQPGHLHDRLGVKFPGGHEITLRGWVQTVRRKRSTKRAARKSSLHSSRHHTGTGLRPVEDLEPTMAWRGRGLFPFTRQIFWVALDWNIR